MQLAQLSEQLNAKLTGDPTVEIETIASLTDAHDRAVSFLSDPRYAPQLAQTKAAAVIIPNKFTDAPPGLNTLAVPDVNQALDNLLLLFAPEPDLPQPGIHPSAVVDPAAQLAPTVTVGPHAVIAPDVTIDDQTVIGPGCVVGRAVTIGPHCQLGPNVVIQPRCTLGRNVIIHANSTIGTDGFGYRLVDGRHQKIPHIGRVIIQDDVEIGSNTCIDRAKFGATTIGAGTKIDNLVQIAHNVQTGQNCIIIAQAGVAGSARLGDYVVLAGQVGVRDHVTIGDAAMVGAQCGVAGDVEPKARIAGSPGKDARTFFRQLKLIDQLPQMAQDLKRLKKSIE